MSQVNPGNRWLFYSYSPYSLLITKGCSDKLLQNDPGFVELSLERLGEDFDIDAFVYAIQANRTVKHVCFSGTFIRSLEPRQWRRMLEAVGNLQTLQELQIWSATIPVGVLARTIDNAYRLRKIYCFRANLEGSNEDFQALASSIRDNPALRDIRLGGLSITESDQPVSMDCVLEALAQASKLEVVSLQSRGGFERVPFSAAALRVVFCSETLEDLHLSRLGLEKSHFAAIAAGLEANKNLKTLDAFGNTIENESIISIANALGKNKSLESLVLPCPTSTDLSVESCAAISDALKSNNTLVTLNLPRSNVGDDGIMHLAQGLTLNTTLKKIELGVNDQMSDKGMDALTDMLEANYDLERLVVNSAETNVKEKVAMYSKLKP